MSTVIANLGNLLSFSREIIESTYTHAATNLSIPFDDACACVAWALCATVAR